MIEISDIRDVLNYIGGLKAVIFDMDDTLYSEKEYIRSGYREVAMVLPQVEKAEERLWEIFESGKPAIDELLRQANIYSEELKHKCLRAYHHQKPDIHLYDGVREMLEELKKGYCLGLITDGRQEGQRAKITALELDRLFNCIIITDELGGIEFRKPNPVAFQLMTEKVGVEYKSMCYVGDNIKKDFKTPEELGIRCIYFKNVDGLYYPKDYTYGRK